MRGCDEDEEEEDSEGERETAEHRVFGEKDEADASVCLKFLLVSVT